MAAYIDLNPVRAGMVEDPAEYRWSSYGEAIGGGAKGNGKKAREGLVRAIASDTDTGFDAGKWKEASRRCRRLLGMALERKNSSPTPRRMLHKDFFWDLFRERMHSWKKLFVVPGIPTQFSHCFHSERQESNAF